jgi:hypothetical protein
MNQRKTRRSESDLLRSQHSRCLAEVMLRLAPHNNQSRSATLEQSIEFTGPAELNSSILIGDEKVIIGRAPAGEGGRCKLPPGWVAVSASHATILRCADGQVRVTDA